MAAFAQPGAYDYANTVFSPDGRLYQVEYARELVNRGGTIIGIKCAEGVVLASEENSENFEETDHSWKIFKIDEHIATAIVGLSSDARVLIDHARLSAQSNKLAYDEPIDADALTQKICNIQQTYTQQGGGRPFGVAMIIGGVDKTGAHILRTHPSGNYTGYKATAIGAGTETVLPMLQDAYREDLTLENCIKLAVKCLLKTLKERELPPKITIATIPTATKKLDMLSDKAVEGYIKETS